MKLTIFRTRDYKWRLLTLKSGKPYIKKEFTLTGFRRWMGEK